MRLVKLTSAMKISEPFVIVGDKDAQLRLSHAAAQFVIAQGNGVYADGGEQPGPSRAALEQQETEIQQAGTLRQVGEETPPPSGELVKRPYGNAPKSAWVRYAVNGDHGQPPITQERAELMTKADLMSRYGERL
jgi:hypothetical protein